MEFVILGLSPVAKKVLKFAILNLLDIGFERKDITSIARLSNNKASNLLQTLKGHGLIRYNKGTKKWYLTNDVQFKSEIILNALVDITL